ncbi:hypothetical protein ACFX1Q_010343 [Malus domestica]
MTGEMMHYVEDDNTSEPIVPDVPVVSEVTSPSAHQAASRASSLASSKVAMVTKVPPPQAQGLGQVSGDGSCKSLQPATCKVVIPKPFKASRVTRILITGPKKTVAAAISASGSSPSISTKAASGDVGVILPPLASIPTITSFPELVREFRNIRTKFSKVPH